MKQMKKRFEEHVDPTLEFKRLKCEELIPVPELNAVQSLCKLLEVLATPQNGVEFVGDRDSFNNICKMWFLFWYNFKTPRFDILNYASVINEQFFLQYVMVSMRIG